MSHPSLQSRSLELHATSRKGTDFEIDRKHDRQRIVYHSLDIHDPSSIDQLQGKIDNVDVLINNAGLNVGDDESVEGVRKTMDTNYRGSLKMCQAFIPKMKKQGRIINISSTASSLRFYAEDIQERFRSASSIEEVEMLANEYISSLQEGLKSRWPPIRQSYSVSKACMNAFTAILAKDNPEIGINCCCPGWVATDMGHITGEAPKTPEEGARIPIHLAFDHLDGVTGRYWGNDTISGTGPGKVQPW